MAHVRRTPALSPRERDVLGLVACGLSSRSVGRQLRLGTSTVETHVRSAMEKLGARTRVHALVLAVELGAVSVPDGLVRGSPIGLQARELLVRLAAGQAVGEAAAAIGISTRTANRRIAAARRSLGAISTGQAVLAVRVAVDIPDRLSAPRAERCHRNPAPSVR